MKEKLKNYRALKLELEDVEAQIGAGVVQDSVQASQSEYPWVKGTRRISGAPDEDYSLLVRKSDLKAQIKEIEDFVNSIPFYKTRKAIRIYFLSEIEEGEDKPTWENVAREIKGGATENSVKKIVSRYLNENL